MTAVGDHRFFINDWYVNLIVNAPCSLQNMEGLDDDGSLTMRLDEEAELNPELEIDSHGNSWKVSCGPVSRTVLLKAPHFVTYDQKEHIISVKPNRIEDLGLHLILVKQFRMSKSFITTVGIMVMNPIDFIA